MLFKFYSAENRFMSNVKIQIRSSEIIIEEKKV